MYHNIHQAEWSDATKKATLRGRFFAIRIQTGQLLLTTSSAEKKNPASMAAFSSESEP
jgi:hypothetical protein